AVSVIEPPSLRRRLRGVSSHPVLALIAQFPTGHPPRSGPLGRGSVFGAYAHGVRLALPARPPTSSGRMVQGSNPQRDLAYRRVSLSSLPDTPTLRGVGPYRVTGSHDVPSRCDRPG